MTDTATAPSALERIRLAAAEAEQFAAGPAPTDASGAPIGIMVALMPPPEVAQAVARPDGTAVEDLHVTLVLFGFDTTTAPDGAVDAIVAAVTSVASEGMDVTLTHGCVMGDTQSYCLEGSCPEVAELQAAITDACTAAGLAVDDQYAFRCHLTIGSYPEGLPTDLVEGPLPEPITWTASEVSVVAGADATVVPLGPPEVEDDDSEPDPADPAEPAEPAEPMVAATDGEPVLADAPAPPVAPDVAPPAPTTTAPLAVAAPAARWSSPCIVPKGVMSGDRRRITCDLRQRPLPLPFAATWTIAYGHDGAQLGGNITEAYVTPTGVAAAGDFDLGSDHGRELYRLAREGRMVGVSVDLDDVTVDLSNYDPETDPWGDLAILDVVDGRLIGMTGVMHPAFAEAAIAVVAAGGPGRARHRIQRALTADGGPRPGAPAPLVLLADDGETIVATGRPIPGHRARFHLERMSFTCGMVPVLPVEDGLLWQAQPLTASGSMVTTHAHPGWPTTVVTTTSSAAGAEPVAPFAPLIARGAPALVRDRNVGRGADDHLGAPPAEWFTPLDGVKTAVEVSPEGEVRGLVARWKDCHVSYADRCVPPPRSRTGYRAFRSGVLNLEDGTRTTVGPMFADTVHPDLALAASDAFAHYADTGCLIAQVAAGENADGIWVHGSLLPGLTPRQYRVAQAGRWSGDWRPMREAGGKAELLSILAVNGPGFPTPGPDAGLVAAGRPGAFALFDGDDLLAGVGLGLVAAGDPCAELDDLALALDDSVAPGAITAMSALFGQLAAQVELLHLAVEQHALLLEPVLAAHMRQQADALAARITAARR